MLRSLFATVAVAPVVLAALASVACSGAAGDESTAGSAAVTTSATHGTNTEVNSGHIFRATSASKLTVVNEGATICADKTSADACEVNTFDFSALNLTADETTTLEAEVRSGQAMVQGTLSQVSVALGGGSRAIELQSNLTVTAAWVSPAASPAVTKSGNYQLVTKNVANCGSINQSNGGTVTCDPYTLTMVNQATTGSSPDVDLTGAAASASAVTSATTALSGKGLLTFGYFEGTAKGPKTYEVTAFFLPVGVN